MVPNITRTTTTEHGVTSVKEETPNDWVDVVTFHPHSSPWDYYGGKQIRETMHVLQACSIMCVGLVTNRTIVSPQGSGPYGRVRFGDNMMPGIYRVAVPKGSVDAAKNAIEVHKNAIHEWLHNNGPMPNACR